MLINTDGTDAEMKKYHNNNNRGGLGSFVGKHLSCSLNTAQNVNIFKKKKKQKHAAQNTLCARPGTVAISSSSMMSLGEARDPLVLHSYYLAQ